MNKRKMPAILLTLWPYLILALMCILSNEEQHNYGVELLFFCVSTAIVYILNVINACKGKKEDISGLMLTDLLVKLIHIPFYLLIFLIGCMALAVMVVPAFVFVSPIVAFLLTTIDFF